MDTLRERQPSHAVSPVDQDQAVWDVTGEDEGVAVIEEARRSPTFTMDRAVTAPANVTDRFCETYRHPDIGCKTIGYATAKRIFDVVGALVLLAFAWPIMMVTALAVVLTSKGPIFFRQVRVGRGGRYFFCYKFRSMCVDAEDKKRLLQHLNEVDGPVFKIRRDPRITRVGAFIRKFSIDELPQLLNVLRGDMSIVGPRPPIPMEVEKYTARERGRLAVQPGLTCLWQVSGRSNIPFEQWIDLDLDYIEKMSMSLDLGIVLRTVPAVLTGAGAH